MLTFLEYLSGIFKKLKVYDIEDGFGHEERCFQTLSLIKKFLEENPMSVKYFSKLNCLKCLTSFLGTNLAPRSQLLVLNLCRQLLPHIDNEEEIVTFVDLFLSCLRTIQFSFMTKEHVELVGKSEESKKKMKSPVKTPTKNAENHIVALFSWNKEESELSNIVEKHKQLAAQEPSTVTTSTTSTTTTTTAETTTSTSSTTAGAETTIEKTAETSNATTTTENSTANITIIDTSVSADVASVAPTSTASSPFTISSNLPAAKSTYLSEINANEYTILFSGSAEKCVNLASEIITLGGTMAVVKESLFYSQFQTSTEIVTQAWSMFWIDAQTSISLSSEYLSLIRLLANSSPKWFNFLQAKLKTVLCEEMPQIIEALNPKSANDKTNEKDFHEKYGRIISCLNILGGFEEVMRVGGTVSSQSLSGEPQKGMKKTKKTKKTRNKERKKIIVAYC